MKIIYLNKEDMRSYASTPFVAWETIELEVPSDFEGGGKRYDLESSLWIDDEMIDDDPEETSEE